MGKNTVTVGLPLNIRLLDRGALTVACAVLSAVSVPRAVANLLLEGQRTLQLRSKFDAMNTSTWQIFQKSPGEISVLDRADFI